MPELRERKSVQAAPAATKPEAEDKSKSKSKAAEPDLEPNIFVVSILFVVFTLVVGGALFYKIDNTTSGPFSTWINEHFPIVGKVLNQNIPLPNFGAHAVEVTTGIKLTEEELKAFDGTDPEQPIYLAINGTIFDVSASPSFYGPGGHYHHFVGKDATRAWVTECWDSEDQFTWRLDGVENIFVPKYLDEQLEEVAQGKWDPSFDGLAGLNLPKEALIAMSKKSIERFGSVTDSEKARRREAAQGEATAKVQEVLVKWVKFFSDNAKYTEVGTVIYDESRPAPPKPCDAAWKKQPIKGGKLDGMMENLQKVAPAAGKAGHVEDAASADGGEKFPENMPDFVKEQIRKDRAERRAEEAAAAAAAGDAAKSVEDTEEVDLTKDDESAHDEL